jgi:hypothetical protein
MKISGFHYVAARGELTNLTLDYLNQKPVDILEGAPWAAFLRCFADGGVLGLPSSPLRKYFSRLEPS